MRICGVIAEYNPLHLGHEMCIRDRANNVLALEYLQACLHLGSRLRPLPIARTGDGYRQQQIEGPLPSATGIRAALYAGQAPSGLPERVARDLSLIHI